MLPVSDFVLGFWSRIYMLLSFIVSTVFSAAFICAHNIQNVSFSERNLYAIQEPFNSGYLVVDDVHKIFFEEFGNPKGVSVLVVHGGPGAGCNKSLSQFFDPNYYHIVMFDQRGCGRSVPLAEMKNNTPQDSVKDMEMLRQHLNIDQWILFGGSYGSLLSILYGETYPDRVQCFVLRGIFLGREQDYKNLFYDMGKFFPEIYQQMIDLFAIEERSDLINAMEKRIMNPSETVHMPLAHAFMYYDLLCAQLFPDFEQTKSVLESQVMLNVSRAFIHYAANNFFLKDDQLLNNIEYVQKIPAFIIHGRYDLICLPQNAYDLHVKWPKSELWFVTNAGHLACELSISQALKNAMDEIKLHNFELNQGY